jgi:amino-acid N-acetyltransferase
MEAYTIRKARMSDIKGMHRLLMSCAQKSQLLPRSLNSLYGHVRDFYVAEEIATGTPVGCCAMTICWEDLAEVRSLALDEAHMGRGVGRAMVQTCLDEAAKLGLSRVFALTYVVDFFRK